MAAKKRSDEKKPKGNGKGAKTPKTSSNAKKPAKNPSKSSKDDEENKKRRKTPSKPTAKSKKKGRKKKHKRPISLYQNIRSLCWAKRRDWYDGYHDDKFLEIVYLVFQECQISDIPCDEKNILELFDRFGKEWEENNRPAKPELPAAYYPTEPPQEFYTIYDINWEIFAKICPNVKIIAPDIMISPSEIDVLKVWKKIKDIPPKQQKSALTAINNKFFSAWVEWCNLVHRTYHQNESPVKIYWAFNDAEWDEERREWVAELYPCDEDGTYWNFGYNPDKDSDEDDYIEFGSKDKRGSTRRVPRESDRQPEPEPEEEPTPEPPTKKGKKKAEPQKPAEKAPEPEAKQKPSDKTKEKKAAKEKQEQAQSTKDQLSNLFQIKNNYLSEQERVIKDASKWKKLGDEEEYQNAKTRYKAIQKKIDKINSEIDKFRN